MHHEGQVRPDLLDAECCLERVDLVDLDTHHRGGARQARFLESLPPVGVAPDMGNAPVVQSSREARIGVVVDHDDLGAAEVELLHGAQADALEPADDHMTLHALRVGAIHAGMLPVLAYRGGCCRVKCGRRGLRRLEPTLGL